MQRLATIVLVFLAALVTLGAGAALGQEIVQAQGLDQRVDYRRLQRYGPWDERNYVLTADDLRLLAPNEEELQEPLPAFFRVLLRKNWPELPKDGPAQYPRSALQIFRLLYGGYQVQGKLYSTVRREANRYRVMEESEVLDLRAAALPSRFLAGETRVTTPIGAAESAVKINPVDSDVVIAGSNGPGPGQKMHFSTDGGATWTETALPLGGTCCDPTVD